MGFGEELQRSMSGKIEKACIQIIDLRVLGDSGNVSIGKVSTSSQYEVIQNKRGGKELSKSASKFAPQKKAALKTMGYNPLSAGEIATIKGSVQSVAGKELADLQKEAVLKAAEAAEYSSVQGGSVKRFWVQFNPSELVLYAQGGGRVQKTSFAEKDGGSNLNFDKADSRITLSVKLYFDTIDLDEAFAGDYLNLSDSSLAKKGIKALKRKKERLTVQQRIEGFTAALRNKFTRFVIFTWGTLEYSGVVTNVNARYTMFDKKGDPIRGEMQLEITLIDMQVETYSLGSWRAMYNKAFIEGKEQEFSLGNSGQNLKCGLFNLGH